jgi:hypothetical protein
VDQFRPKNLKPLLDLRCPVLNFFIDVGSFVEPVADMHIHSCPDTGEDPVKLTLRRILHPDAKSNSGGNPAENN